jgi:hypothetical protein
MDEADRALVIAGATGVGLTGVVDDATHKRIAAALIRVRRRVSMNGATAEAQKTRTKRALAKSKRLDRLWKQIGGCGMAAIVARREHRAEKSMQAIPPEALGVAHPQSRLNILHREEYELKQRIQALGAEAADDAKARLAEIHAEIGRLLPSTWCQPASSLFSYDHGL